MSDNKLNAMEEQAAANEATKKPFYQSVWWVILWCLLIWPVGLLMILWYITNIQTDAMPRTKLLENEKPTD
ncbi:MAG: hypothetical protein HY818_00940 [Acetobacterium woodii]|nr:hypothetical protein [Acetobacterium woodii]